MFVTGFEFSLMGRVSIAISVQSLSRSYAHTVIHSDESLFLDQTCAGVVVFSGCLPSFRRQNSDLRHRCPQSEATFLHRNSESGMFRTQSRDFGWKQCSAQADHLYRRRKILESRSTNFAWRSNEDQLRSPIPQVTACLVCDRNSVEKRRLCPLNKESISSSRFQFGSA
jgi:hypothetical protein